MKLYTDNNGRWAGTQADAKQFGAFEQVEVPTDKPNLLEFLNKHSVGADNTEYHTYDDERTKANNTTEKTPQPHYNPDTRPSRWTDIRDAAEKASLKDWGVVLAVLMNRLDEIADEEA